MTVMTELTDIRIHVLTSESLQHAQSFKLRTLSLKIYVLFNTRPFWQKGNQNKISDLNPDTAYLAQNNQSFLNSESMVNRMAIAENICNF